MPRISIAEVDNTLYSAVNTRDNIVFIPGTAIKGSYDEPILITNIRDFVDTFGNHAPANGSIRDGVISPWEYAYNLIDAGFSVLYRRIVPSSFATPVSGAIKRSITSGGDTTTKNTIIIKAKYPGSYANNIYYILDKDELKIFYCNGTTRTDKDKTNADHIIGLSNFSYETYRLVDENGNSLWTSVSADGKSGTISKASLITLCNKINTYFNNVEIELVPDSDSDNKIDSDEVAIIIPFTVYVKTVNGSDKALTCYEKLSSTNASDPTYNDIITYLEDDSNNIYEVLKDKYIYDVKFITSGGYTCSSLDSTSWKVSSKKIYNDMLDAAYTRSDCLAIFDIPFVATSDSEKMNLYRAFEDLKSGTKLSYAAAYAPWIYKLSPESNEYMWCPPSYVFLYTLAESIKRGSFTWQIPAGVNRGSVSNAVSAQYQIGETLMNKWQDTEYTSNSAINPIVNLRNYGYVIYGQRTLYAIDPNTRNWTSALREIGVRLVTIDIKKRIFDISLGLTFEGNNVHTWSEFCGQLTPFLENIKAHDGILHYEIIMDSNTNTTEQIARNTVKGIVRISPSRAAENFDITFELNNDVVYINDASETVVVSEI